MRDSSFKGSKNRWIMKLHIVTRHPLSYNKSEPWFRILERLSTWRSTIYKYLIPSLFAFTRAFESSARVTTVFVRKKRYATSKWFFFFFANTKLCQIPGRNARFRKIIVKSFYFVETKRARLNNISRVPIFEQAWKTC